MKEQNEMPAAINSPLPRFRYWSTPPEMITIRVTDLEPFVPKANWILPVPEDLAVEIPADKIFLKNVPRISLRLLAELLPDHVFSSDGAVKLPASKLAAAYRLVEHSEELIPEPVVLPAPEVVPTLEEFVPPPGPIDAPISFKPNSVEPAAIVVPTEIDPAPISEIPATPPEASAIPEELNPPQAKVPVRRSAPFVGLPIFRRKAPVVTARPIPPPPISVPPLPVPVEESVAPEDVLPAEPAFAEPPSAFEEPPAAFVEPPAAVEPEPEPPVPITPAIPVRILRTEHFPSQTQNQEIVEQEPLQALFLTEETMTVSRVIDLCGGLPGINSCVLANGSVVVASHNVPDGVDLVSMSAHAADMLRAMRDSSARMGVGTVPAVTLHTEKGVISFFHRDDLTMLVFHKDRGFVPGVREKMAAVLGELTKARLTLPADGNETT